MTIRTEVANQMSRPPGLRPVILAAKEKLREGREKLRLQHASGSPGIQVAAHLTDIVDTVLLNLYEAAIAELGDVGLGLQREVALVPNGGYGRRDLAPYSDVDLMLLCRENARERSAPLARLILQFICDTGLDLGFSVRSPTECAALALDDATIFTSLAESRFLAGSVSLYENYMNRYRAASMRNWRRLVNASDESRKEERLKYGESVYMLKPNVKRSRGCLRDIQLVRWAGFARYGQSDPENLYRAGRLSKTDRDSLRDARDFLLRLRNEMHFHSARSNDILGKDEQLRIAKAWGYPGAGALLPVEELMSEYFHHTSSVRSIAGHFLATVRSETLISGAVEMLFSHKVEGDFRVGPTKIWATRRGLKKLSGDLSEVLRLMDLANMYDKRIDDDTWEAIRADMMVREEIELTPDATERFLSVLSEPARLGSLLRRLHELRVLEKIIPPMAHARCLLQFNEYHKYTVDEHSILAVQRATEFASRKGPLGEVYRNLSQKRMLHLALLMHDLGKGFEEDHSDIGARLTVGVAKRLGLSQRDSTTLRFLVQNHLLMSQTALQQDINDDNVVVQFAVTVGSPDVLQLLYLITCADIDAVGPGVLNDWKVQLINDLYRRTMRHVAGDDPPMRSTEEGVRRRREQVRAAVTGDDSPYAAAWWDQQVEALPSRWLFAEPRKKIVESLEKIRQMPDSGVTSWGEYLPDRGIMEYSTAARDEIAEGAFHRLTGVLTSRGLQIVWAQIDQLAGGLVVDRFHVEDTDFADEPPAERIEEVCQKLTAAVMSPTEPEVVFRRMWGSSGGDEIFHRLPTRVGVDNQTSPGFTILHIFAHDRRGLLYAITRALFELGLSVKVAKIGTYIDQVVDVFYVRTQDGEQVTDEQRLKEIERTLIAAVDSTTPAEQATN